MGLNEKFVWAATDRNSNLNASSCTSLLVEWVFLFFFVLFFSNTQHLYTHINPTARTLTEPTITFFAATNPWQQVPDYPMIARHSRTRLTSSSRPCPAQSWTAAAVAELFGTGRAGNPAPKSAWAGWGIINGVGQAPLIPPEEERPPAPDQDR